MNTHVLFDALGIYYEDLILHLESQVWDFVYEVAENLSGILMRIYKSETFNKGIKKGVYVVCRMVVYQLYTNTIKNTPYLFIDRFVCKYWWEQITQQKTYSILTFYV